MTNCQRFLPLLFAVAPVALVLLAAEDRPAAAADIYLREQCRAAESTVRLSDVARLYGDTPQVLARLAEVELASAPPAGRRRSYRMSDVQLLLTQRGIRLSEHRFGGASQVLVEGAPRAEATDPEPQSEVPTPSGVSVVVAVRPLRRGERVRADDVELVDAALAPAAGQSNVFASLEEAIGKEVTRAIGAQQPIGASSVRQPIYVSRGNAVTVYVRSGQVQLTTSARAEEQGSLGEVITCQSIYDRKKKFFAKVIGPDQVLVFPGGISAGN